jgi:DNA-binding transcriptional regulator LsrR (DeoR family)
VTQDAVQRVRPVTFGMGPTTITVLVEALMLRSTGVEGITATAIAASTGLERSSVTRAIGVLKNRGIITVQHQPTHRGRVAVIGAFHVTDPDGTIAEALEARRTR